MTRSPGALRLGVFVVGGLALLLFAVVTVSGGMWFTRHERVVMHFGNSIYGLQVGAPVVFQGVRVGRVVDMRLAPALAGPSGATGGLRAPVQADLDLDLLLPPGGVPAAGLAALVEQGLTARLASQSLLTGLLYVELFQGPPLARAAARGAQTPGAMLEIPTAAAPMQALLGQLQGLDLAALVEHLDALARSARALTEAPALHQGLEEAAALATELRGLVARAESRLDSLASAGETTLARTRETLQAIDAAAQALTQAARQTQQGVDRLVQAGMPALASTGTAAEELGRSAAALRAALDSESALMQGLARGSQDVARAARALRELAELLERQPQVLLRGRQDPP